MAPTTSQSEKIPVIDLGNLDLGQETETSQEEWQRVAKQLHQAFTDIGCAYLTNHGVPDDKLSLLYEAASTFFSLPQEKKNLFKFDPESVNGYVPIDGEKYSSSDHELHEGILAKNTDRIPCFQEIPSFKTAIESFLFSCRALSEKIMAAISISLGKDKDYLLSMHQKAGTADSLTTMRMNFYPPVPPTTLGNTTRFGAHKDYSTFSLIFQDDNGGLQVLDREGSWLDVPNSPGAVVILGRGLHKVLLQRQVQGRDASGYHSCRRGSTEGYQALPHVLRPR
ncbi:uncharacterized protein [Procambarus clarkii]|uniref:uncharacterized protein n=1 Tax=Procambarus clarkii TaxID=6728 RepID=UPI0037430E2B